MPTSSPVYQPTTVTYESTSPPEHWSNRPVSYLSATVSRTRGPCIPSRGCFPHMLLVIGLLTFLSGIIMLVQGIFKYNKDSKIPERQSVIAGDLILAVAGGIFICAGIVSLGIYIRTSRIIRNCCRNGKDLDTIRNQGSTLNPSTDLLVAAQYAPVSEVAYQPPQPMQEDMDTERSKLMPQDNKECASGEESDRMMEPDPRIVLRPLNKLEDA